MKALSVRQPWAWALIHGNKRIENRSRRIYHRGPLLIHASRSLAEFGRGRDHSRLMPQLPAIDDLAFGAIIGMVDVVDCIPITEMEPDPFAEGPWCWIVAKPRPVVPVPWTGQVSLFDVPDRLIRPTRPAPRTRRTP
jgi:hypothetical protein